MASKYSDTVEKKNRNTDEAEMVFETIVTTVLDGQVSEDEEHIYMCVDVDGVSILEQTDGVMVAAACLNGEYGYEFWANPHIITNDPEKTAEKIDEDPDELKEEMFPPERFVEEHERHNPDYPSVPALNQDKSTEHTVVQKKIENLSDDLQDGIFEEFGFNDKEEKTEFIDSILTKTKARLNEIDSQTINAAYIYNKDLPDLTTRQKTLYAMIIAHLVGHKGVRVACVDGDIAIIDDIRMFADRHGYHPWTIVNRSWTLHEAQHKILG